jgi:HTH-type transcriptional regulator/antitoxin HigA
MTTNTIIPHKATHPGLVLIDELKSRNISQKDFALDIDMQPTMLNEIVKGKRAITAEIALLLEKTLDIPAVFWLNFQTQYQLDEARIKDKLIQKTQQIEIWKLIKQFVPVSIFAKLGVLSNSLTANISIIWDIYEVNSIDMLVERVSIHKNMEYYRKSEKLKNDHINIFAWSRWARWQAESEKVNSFDLKNKNAVITELNSLFYLNNNVLSETKRVLNKYGIKFLVIEKFKHSPIDGYSFWSNNEPAIVLTLRKKHLDNFAFTIMHELGHVFEHLQPDHSEDFLDIEYPESDMSEKEQEANRFARLSQIEDSVWQDFYRRNPEFNYQTTEKHILQLSSELKIHPSIILGRFCFETGNFAVKSSIDKTIL